MSKIAIIGGTGLTSIKGFEITGRDIVQTPFGEPSGPLVRGELSGSSVYFLPRHGADHTIPPHKNKLSREYLGFKRRRCRASHCY